MVQYILQSRSSLGAFKKIKIFPLSKHFHRTVAKSSNHDLKTKSLQKNHTLISGGFPKLEPSQAMDDKKGRLIKREEEEKKNKNQHLTNYKIYQTKKFFG